MKNPPKYLNFIDHLIAVRESVDGFDCDIVIDANDPKLRRLYEHPDELHLMLDQLKRNRVKEDGESHKPTVISNYHWGNNGMVTIVGSTTEKLKNFRDLIDASDGNRPTSRIAPLMIPEGIDSWEKVMLVFRSSRTLDIYYELGGTWRRRERNMDCSMLGFMNKKTSKANAQWILLHVFAKVYGRILLTNLRESERRRMTKQKQLLSKQLTHLFRFRGDPFHDYRDIGAYALKMKLAAENSPRPSTASISTDDELDANAIEDMFSHNRELGYDDMRSMNGDDRSSE